MKTLHRLGMSLVAILFASMSTAAEPKAWVAENLENLVTLYRYLHSHPELSKQEKETAARIAAEWKAAGFEVTTGVGGHGVVGLLKNGPGKTLMLRTDLDALPVTEKTELPYASQVRVKDRQGNDTGVMHACGHDVHMTNLVGVARWLGQNKSQWKGTVMLIGQPAEEMGAGARAMLDDGLFKRFPKPDFGVALHVDSELETGRVGVREGWAMANVDSVDIIVRGKGGHGASPHRTIDPVVQAAELILSLQTLVSRETNPIEPAVITVGSIHGGTKHNIIGNECHLLLTVRSFTDEVRKHLLDGIRRKAKAIALSYNAPEPSVTVSEGTPSLFNEGQLTRRLQGLFERTLGKEQVASSEQTMGGEDFSEYGRAGVPICMYRLGVVNPKRMARYKELGAGVPSLHSPIFYPDVEEALTTGIVSMVAAVKELLPP